MSAAVRLYPDEQIPIVGLFPAQYGPEAIEVYQASNYVPDRDSVDRTATLELVRVDVIAWAVDELGNVAPIVHFPDVPGFDLRGDVVRTVICDEWWAA